MAKAEVRIFNRTYTLNAPTESQEDLLRYAAMVDEKMREIAQDTRMIDTEKIALVAALNIAAEYFRIKVKLEELEEEIERKVGQIVQLVEKAQGEGGQ